MINKKELISSINRLKSKKNAIILAHNFQSEEVQDAADFVGDSLELSQRAMKSKAAMIVVCGVRFMAETIKILSPEKKILLADKNSSCPLAEMINVGQLKDFKKDHPGAVVACYINSPAEIKASSDICLSSSNALKVIEGIEKNKPILCIPDKYLAGFIKKMTQREIVPWNGYCPVHVSISPKNMIALKKEHLDADVLVHPQCTPDVIALSDRVLGTGQMVRYVKDSKKDTFIIATEIGINYRLKKENPQKTFLPASKNAICKNMRLVTLEKIFHSLRLETFQIDLKPEIMKQARACLQRMER